MVVLESSHLAGNIFCTIGISHYIVQRQWRELLNLPCQLSRGHLGASVLVNFTAPQGGNVIPILEERSDLPNIPTTSLLLNQD